MNRASCVITSTAQERFEQYGHRAYQGAVDVNEDAHFAVIPPGVNLRIFDEFATNDREKAVQIHIDSMIERDIEAGRRHLPVVLSSSRLDAKKNHLGLVQAFAQSPELQAVANLAIVVRGVDNPLRNADAIGGEEERYIFRQIVALVDEYGLRGKITAFPLNSQSELAAGYRHLARRKSVFCLTALYEPFGLAPLEAMAAGLPAVVTENGGPSESLYDKASDTEYGVLVDPSDPDSIARGLLKAVGKPKDWQRYHDAGIKRVHDKYTWQRTAEGYLRVIESMISGIEPIPEYFQNPSTSDGTIEDLAALYFS